MCAKNFYKCFQMGITGVTDGYVLLKSQELSMMGGWRLDLFGQDFKEGREIYSHPRNRYMPISFLFTELPPPQVPRDCCEIPSPLETHCCDLLHPSVSNPLPISFPP